MVRGQDNLFESNKIKRCGFCGRYFIGDKFLSEEEIKNIPDDVLMNAPADYCHDSMGEYAEQNPERITRDMAMDAGDLSMEGEIW